MANVEFTFDEKDEQAVAITTDADHDFNVSETTPDEDGAAGSTVEYASIARRFWAFVIDYIMFVLLSLPISFLTGMLLAGIAIQGAGVASVSHILEAHVTFIGYTLSLLLSVIYYMLIPPNWGGKTIGRAIMRIRVVVSDGSNVSYSDMFMREGVGRLLSAITFMGGYLVAFGDDEKRTLHDRLANTRVIRV